MQDVWTDRLSEYLDDELDRNGREELEAHLEGCPHCASALAELRLVRARARDLSNAPVPREIWSRIEAVIAERKKIPFPEYRTVKKRPAGGWAARSFSLPELVAACLGIAILSGGTVFAVLQGRVSKAPAPAQVATRTPEQTAAPAETPTSAPPVEHEPAPATMLATSTNRAAGGSGDIQTTPNSPHEEAIAELRKALAKERDRLDPATIRTLEANLAIIDLAIDQAKRALAADPANTYVREHLAETMRRKVELLQRATMLASASPEGR
jgi:hypothetical protein